MTRCMKLSCRTTLWRITKTAGPRISCADMPHFRTRVPPKQGSCENWRNGLRADCWVMRRAFPSARCFKAYRFRASGLGLGFWASSRVVSKRSHAGTSSGTWAGVRRAKGSKTWSHRQEKPEADNGESFGHLLPCS